MADVQYTQYYVAFLDILGFKNLVSGPKKAACQDILNMYKWAESVHSTFFAGNWEAVQYVNRKVMSDSICLYIEADKPNALSSLVLFCTAFQYQLLALQPPVFVRGGITFGDMFIEDDIVFGPALTQAYLLEEKNAKVPRIIMLKETLDYGKSQLEKDAIRMIELSIFQDDDAFYAVNYFLPLCFIGDDPDILDRVKATVSDYLNTTIDESIRQKYLYVEKNMRKYLNARRDIKENPNA